MVFRRKARVEKTLANGDRAYFAKQVNDRPNFTMAKSCVGCRLSFTRNVGLVTSSNSCNEHISVVLVMVSASKIGHSFPNSEQSTNVL